MCCKLCVLSYSKFWTTAIIDILAFSKGVLWVNFIQICSSPRSAADYIEISKEFHTIVLSDVPIINSDDEARRFISFIDECYDRRVKLIISAAELPEKIYVKSRLEEKFKRTISRLTEMQSKDYLSQAHLAWKYKDRLHIEVINDIM